jgi:hypothetical protein
MKNIIIGIFLLVLASSCTKQGDAEKIVNSFIESNAIAPEKIIEREFSVLDSTNHLTDSIVVAMQQMKKDRFKDHIQYVSGQCGRVLYFLRMKYIYEGDTVTNTFYLDENLTTVVSFK